MTIDGPDLLLALGFALGGAGLGLVGGVALTFWFAGRLPGRNRPDPKP